MVNIVLSLAFLHLELLCGSNFASKFNYLARLPSPEYFGCLALEIYLVFSAQFKADFWKLRSDHPGIGIALAAAFLFDFVLTVSTLLWCSKGVIYLKWESKRIHMIIFSFVAFVQFTQACECLFDGTNSFFYDAKFGLIDSCGHFILPLFYIKTIFKLLEEWHKNHSLSLMGQNNKKTEDFLQMCFLLIESHEELYEKHHLNLFQDGLSLRHLHFEAYIAHHKTDCADPECICQKPLGLEEKGRSENFLSFFISTSLLRDEMTRVLSKERVNIRVYFIFCIFLMRCSKNHLQASSYIADARPFALSFTDRFLTFVLIQMLSERVKGSNTRHSYIELLPSLNQIVQINPDFKQKHKDDGLSDANGTLDFERIIFFEKQLGLLYSKIMNYSYEQVFLWQMVKSRKESQTIETLEKTRKVLEKLEKMFQKITSLVRKTQENFGISRQTCLMYGVALLFLRNTPKAASSSFKSGMIVNQNRVEKFIREAFLSSEFEDKETSVISSIYKRVAFPLNLIVVNHWSRKAV